MWTLFLVVVVIATVIFLLSPSIRRRDFHSLKSYSVTKSLFNQRREEERTRRKERDKHRQLGAEY